MGALEAVTALLALSMRQFGYLSTARQDPAGYTSGVIRGATASVSRAVREGEGQKLIEVEFVVSPHKNDVSLGETLDATRQIGAQLARGLASRDPDASWLVYPDNEEAKLAARAVGKVPSRILSLKQASEADPEKWPELILVHSTGYNIDEFFQVEKLIDRSAADGGSIVAVNCNIDRLRSGYYPSLLYPRLAKSSRRCFDKFDPVFYASNKLIGGGWLVRSYPDEWCVVVDIGGAQQVVLSSATRPAPSDAERAIRSAFAAAQAQ